MELKMAISCNILRHTKILIAVGVCIISLATLGSKNHTTNITKIVTQSIGIIIKRDRKSGSAGMPRPISYAVFCLKKKKQTITTATDADKHQYELSRLSTRLASTHRDSTDV